MSIEAPGLRQLESQALDTGPDTCVQPACAVCPAMTAEIADLAVVSAEGIAGWNTLQVCTAQGEGWWSGSLAPQEVRKWPR